MKHLVRDLLVVLFIPLINNLVGDSVINSIHDVLRRRLIIDWREKKRAETSRTITHARRVSAVANTKYKP